jgi:hypothetical protein
MRYPGSTQAGPAIFLGGLILLIAACAPPPPTPGSPATTPAPSVSSPVASSSPAASLAPSPSADPISSALSATTARGTARVALELLTAAEGVERELIGEGVVDFARGATDLRWTAAAGPSREVRTEEGFFVEVEPGQWLAVAPDRPTPTSDAGAVLRGIAGLQEAALEGSDAIDGQAATRIRGWLPAAGNDAGLGLTDPERAVVAQSQNARVQVTIWVDESGRIVQVMRTLEGAEPVSATSVARISDLGVAAPIAPPSSIAASAQ